MTASTSLSFLEICAGAGGLALGLETAGFTPKALVEINAVALQTLRYNRSSWPLIEEDVREFDPAHHRQVYDVDLMSAGMPRVKSMADIQRPEDRAERELLKTALYLVGAVQPRAVLMDNVPGLVDKEDFQDLRNEITDELTHLGYRLHWQVLNAADYGVPQNRKHGFLVGLKEDQVAPFTWPSPLVGPSPTVGDTLHASMAQRGWPHADAWAAHAQSVAPTIVGGSERRGGPDLGPERAKKIWDRMGINGGTIADNCPGRDDGWPLGGVRGDLPPLTVEQAALLQGFPPDWRFPGRKTRSYKQLGQALPPPLAAAIGRQIAASLTHNPSASSTVGEAG